MSLIILHTAGNDKDDVVMCLLIAAAVSPLLPTAATDDARICLLLTAAVCPLVLAAATDDAMMCLLLAAAVCTLLLLTATNDVVMCLLLTVIVCPLLLLTVATADAAIKFVNIGRSGSILCQSYDLYFICMTVLAFISFLTCRHASALAVVCFNSAREVWYNGKCAVYNYYKHLILV